MYLHEVLHINRFFGYCFVLALFREPHFSLDTLNSYQSEAVMKQSAFHLQKINYTKIRMTPNKNFPSKIHIFNIPKFVFYFCILQIIAPELLIILHIIERTKLKLRQKTVFCFTLSLLIGNILNTNYQNSPTYENSPNHPYML